MSMVSTIKWPVSLAFLLSVSTLATAQTSGVEGEILTSGIYRIEQPIPPELVNTPETLLGVNPHAGKVPVLILSTNYIPAKIGVHFGMTYFISNLPNGMVDITKIVKHPVMIKVDGTISTCYTNIEKCSASYGYLSGYAGYSFDHGYELVPGKWQFELLFRGKSLCKSEFTVFKE